MLKVAQYAAQLEDYDKAIQIYEQVCDAPNVVTAIAMNFLYEFL